MSSTTVDNGIKYTNPQSNELSMIFNFHHLKVDYDEGENWSDIPFDFLELKKLLMSGKRECLMVVVGMPYF